MLSVERVFPFLAVAVSLLAWLNPQPLMGLTDAIIPLLTIIMFSMGLTLRWQDFRRIWDKPEPIALGVILQFGLMPLIAWILCQIFSLPDDIATGLIIVGACAGGTASNVMTFLARGDVALSVSMTIASTLWGLLLTPWLVAFYARDSIEVDNIGMLLMIAKIVILPITAGVLINRFLPQVQQSVHQYLPSIATGSILLIIAIIVAANADELSAVSISVVAAVILHNLSGFAAGYGIARWNGHTEVQARTIAIEVGMQNSGLGVALANSFFGPMAAIPGALFSVWQNIAGAVLAGFWKWRTDRAIKQLQQARSKGGCQ
jgi:BASS family bile acid:Na+ symporter